MLPQCVVRQLTTVDRCGANRRRTGEKYFAPTHAVHGYIGVGATIWGAAIVDTQVMVD